VNYAIEFASREEIIDCSGVGNIGFDKLKTIAPDVRMDVCPFDRGIVEVVEVINHRQASITVAHQAIDKMASDEPGPAGH